MEMYIVYNDGNCASQAGIRSKMGKDEPPFLVYLGQGMTVNNFLDSSQQTMIGQTQRAAQDNLFRVKGRPVPIELMPVWWIRRNSSGSSTVLEMVDLLSPILIACRAREIGALV